MRARRLLVAVGIAVATLGAAARVAAAAPAVVASILPVHALVAAVGDGVFEPVLLVAGQASPHAYALRPSDARLLQGADAVFWIGERLETFLVRPLKALPARARRVALAEAPGVRLLPVRQGGGFAAHDHGDDHGHDHGHGAAIDMHVWLDPRNAAAMAAMIVATLADLDPGNAERYRANGARLQARLDALEAGLAARLAPVRERPFVVFHDAYHYFEDRFGLRAVGAVSLDPERPPGARRLAAIRKTIGRSGAVCVFAEPQFNAAVVTSIVDGTAARIGVLDPIGAAIPPGPEAYDVLLVRLATAIAECLAAGPPG